MIVYGDQLLYIDPAAERSRIAVLLTEAAAMPPGHARHMAVVRILIALGRLVQALADHDREIAEVDGASPHEAALMPILLALGQAVIASWDSGFASLPPLPVVPPLPSLPGRLEARDPEGYAHYAVYPETYALAARRLRRVGRARVIGIRSIGTSLAAIVAAALDAPAPITVRPIGHPFDRRVAVDAAATARVLGDCDYVVVVDEGPGLSGSSFAAVARWLGEHGVADPDIFFMPSHGGAPGSASTPEVRATWSRVAVHPAGAGGIELDTLRGWAEPVIGPVHHVEAISGGGWRAHTCSDESLWPAVDPFREANKFLLRTGRGDWIMKFAGLGDIGVAKQVRAQLLGSAGLIPQAVALLHGYLLQRWSGTPVAPDDPDLVPAVAHYLERRAALLPPPDREGAALGTLFQMAAANIREGLGQAAEGCFHRLYGAGPELQPRVRPTAIDGRLDIQKWLRAPDGAILKADALDHDRSHDLIGPQDFAWDVAGAITELHLEQRVPAFLAAIGREVDAELLFFLRPCYLAFRMGLADLATASLAGWPEEAARNRAARDRHAAALDRLLATNGDATTSF